MYAQQFFVRTKFVRTTSLRFDFVKEKERLKLVSAIFCQISISHQILALQNL